MRFFDMLRNWIKIALCVIVLCKVGGIIINTHPQLISEFQILISGVGPLVLMVIGIIVMLRCLRK